MQGDRRKITSPINAKLGGRPISEGRLAANEALDKMRKRFAKEGDKWYEALEAAALGHYKMVIGADGKSQRVYKTSPNPTAISEMFDRAFGKPEQAITGEMTQDVTYRIVRSATGEDKMVEDDTPPSLSPVIEETKP